MCSRCNVTRTLARTSSSYAAESREKEGTMSVAEPATSSPSGTSRRERLGMLAVADLEAGVESPYAVRKSEICSGNGSHMTSALREDKDHLPPAVGFRRE